MQYTVNLLGCVDGQHFHAVCNFVTDYTLKLSQLFSQSPWGEATFKEECQDSSRVASNGIGGIQ
jgi:hypothetical protein